MTTQEKIQQLAMAALRSAPVPTGVPKPATFMASPEKLKAALPVVATLAADPAPRMMVAPLPTPEAGVPFPKQGANDWQTLGAMATP